MRLVTVNALMFGFCLFLLPSLNAKGVTKSNINLIQNAFINVNYYPYLEDARNDTTLTIVSGAKLPYGFSYFGFVNYWDNDGKDKARSWDRFYTEQTFMQTPHEDYPVDLSVQWNARSGNENDRLRLGFFYRLADTKGIKEYFDKINLFYGAYFHLYQFDHQGGRQWHIEHVYRMKVLPEMLDNRVYVGGFADQLFGEVGGVHWVTETQLGVRVYGDFYWVTEYRYNTFKDADENNVAMGVEYKFKF